MSTTAQTITMIASLFAGLGVQTVWIVHALKGLGQRVSDLDVHLSAHIAEQGAQLGARIAEGDAHLGEAIGTLDRHLGERIARSSASGRNDRRARPRALNATFAGMRDTPWSSR
jgi:hypothetical protein